MGMRVCYFMQTTQDFFLKAHKYYYLAMFSKATFVQLPYYTIIKFCIFRPFLSSNNWLVILSSRYFCFQTFLAMTIFKTRIHSCFPELLLSLQL